eukprot:s658_g3.t1
MSPSTDMSSQTAVAGSAPAGVVSSQTGVSVTPAMPVPPGMVNPGTLNTGTTPVYDMSGPGGPPTTYGPAAMTGSGGCDPLQGAGDPWRRGIFGQPNQPVNAAALFPGSDGSGLSSSTFQTAAGQSGTTGHSGTGTPSTGGCTFAMPPGFLDATTHNVGGPRGPGIDPVLATMLQQQMVLTQAMVDMMSRSAQSSTPVIPPMPGSSGQAGNTGGGSASTERLTMDSKWIPSAPLPEWKTWTSRARELAGFKGWLERFASWLCLIHDAYAGELKEALTLPHPVEVINADQAIRSRRLFHLIQQGFSGYSRVENVIRPEALHYREATLKYTVKKADKHLLAEAPEPSSSKPDAEDQETEVKFPESLTVNEALETKRDSKRQRMTPSEVAAEGMPDAELTLKMLRLCQSSLEYTARQSKALQDVQSQLGETASLAFHSESCMRYALAAINQSSGHLKGMHWQLTGGRSSEHVSCKSLLQNIASATGKMEKAMGKLVETFDKQGTQAAERDKQFGDVFLALQDPSG